MPQCRQCHKPFEVTAAESAFLQRLAPAAAGSAGIAPPSSCPACRLQRRMSFRNQIYFGYVHSAAAGRQIFSMFPAAVPFPVLPNEDWWGERGWSPEDYGRDFNFSRPFFEQFFELFREVPQPATNTVQMENSDYCTNAGSLKNCYFCCDCNNLEACLYVETATFSQSCLDCNGVHNCELCYDCVNCLRCYGLQSSNHCSDCQDGFFLYNCRSCKHCFGCINLCRQEYCIFNKRVTKADYEKFLYSLDLGSFKVRSRIKAKATAYHNSQPHPHIFGQRLENCSGNQINAAKDIHVSFLVSDAERLSHCFAVGQQTFDCQDYTIWGQNAELIYESLVCGNNILRLAFCINCWPGVTDLLYCINCHGSTECFGCVGMRKRRFSILNRRYSAEDYHRLLPRIIEHMRQSGEWGEFFPAQYSPIPYNMSLAQRYFPMDQATCRSQGRPWLEPVSGPQAEALAEIPDRVPEQLTTLTLRSEGSGRAFKVVGEELRRLREFNAPLPHGTYDERMDERAQRAGGVKLFERRCDKSGRSLLTIHPPTAPYPVWDKELLEQDMV